jgi:hypothetical protein
MSLPKIDYPIYNLKVPSLKKDFKFRPFLVKEEKLLLMARENENPIEILSTIKQIVNNCSLDKNFDVNKIALFDLEYLFLKLRAVSVENTINVTYKDNEDGKTYDFEIDLDKVEVVFPPKMENNIKITAKSGMVMKYPSASLYDDESFLSMEKEQLFALIVRCIDSIYFEDEVYNASDYKREELEEFLEGLDIKTFEKVQNFLSSSPKLEKKLEYTNSLGNKREIVLNTLSDFFTWR